jgi:glucose-6-phosphate isomerase, archaeal
MPDLPFSFILPSPFPVPSQFDNHLERRLSHLKGYFQDEAAYQQAIAKDDARVYEVYEIKRPETSGEMLMGVSIVHPGKIGDEFFFTKGHYHAVLETAEVYLVLRGEGCMVMENPEGETAVEWLTPNHILYVPPRWAHRSVCTSRQEPLITYFIYPAHSGHDYASIETTGFRKLVVEGRFGIEVIDNPRCQA